MKNISRRHFIEASLGSLMALPLTRLSGISKNNKVPVLKAAKINLGQSGIRVSRLAMGTGTNGWNQVSDQTRLGIDSYTALLGYGYERGITFWDTADIYGSHPAIRKALKQIPREKVVIMTKVWTGPTRWRSTVNIMTELDRFRKELGTDMIDIVLLHCQTDSNWPEQFKQLRDALSEAKAKKIIRAHGCSCHSLAALKAAARSSWVEVVLARINHAGRSMDDTPDKVLPVLKRIHSQKKAVIGMKIFGCGKLSKPKQRQQSLKYVLGSGCVDALSIGFLKKSEIDDTISQINRLLGV